MIIMIGNLVPSHSRRAYLLLLVLFLLKPITLFPKPVQQAVVIFQTLNFETPIGPSILPFRKYSMYKHCVDLLFEKREEI